MSEKVLIPTVSQYDNFFRTQWGKNGLQQIDPIIALQSLIAPKLNDGLRLAGAYLVTAIATDMLQHIAVVTNDPSCKNPLILLPDPQCVDITCDGNRLGPVIDLNQVETASGVNRPDLLLGFVNTRVRYLSKAVKQPYPRIVVAYDYSTYKDGIIIGPLKSGAYERLMNGMITGTPHV